MTGNARYRVLVADAIDVEALTPLTHDDRFSVIVKSGLKGDDLARAVGESDAVIVRSSTKITRESLQRANSLRVIGRAGVGVDTIDVDAATERGIAVLIAPSGNTISAAEMTMALMLSLVRRVPAADTSMKKGEWDRKSFSGSELYGKTLVLVGAGRIGGEVAVRARAFGMRVIVYDPFLSAERAQTLQVEQIEALDDALPLADVVSVHVPMTNATAGLLNAARLALLKRGAYLVNAARGGIVDEAALANALNTGALGGAAVDVYSAEPLPADHPLRTTRNTVLTPHLGASTTEAQRNVAVEIAIAVREALLEGDLSRAVNAPALGGEEMRRLQPLLDLAKRLGTLAAGLIDGSMERIEVRYAGAEAAALRPVAAGVMIGAISTQLEPYTINIVNALHVARTRGIQVSQVALEPYRGYAEYVEVVVHAHSKSLRVAGALLSRDHPRVVRIGDFHVDVNPRGTMIVLRNRDVPGVIGRVGTILGEARINIGEYHQARIASVGEAMAAITIDGELDAAVLMALRALPDVLDVRQVRLDGSATR